MSEGFFFVMMNWIDCNWWFNIKMVVVGVVGFVFCVFFCFFDCSFGEGDDDLIILDDDDGCL